MTSTGIPEKTRKLVREREDGQCASCRQPMTDIHHRLRKGKGGTSSPTIHDPSNLIGLCRSDHSWIHQNPAAAILCGLIVPTHLEPLMVPVWSQNANFAWPCWLALGDDLTVRWVSDFNEPLVLPPGMPSLAAA